MPRVAGYQATPPGSPWNWMPQPHPASPRGPVPPLAPQLSPTPGQSSSGSGLWTQGRARSQLIQGRWLHTCTSLGLSGSRTESRRGGWRGGGDHGEPARALEGFYSQGNGKPLGASEEGGDLSHTFQGSDGQPARQCPRILV